MYKNDSTKKAGERLMFVDSGNYWGKTPMLPYIVGEKKTESLPGLPRFNTQENKEQAKTSDPFLEGFNSTRAQEESETEKSYETVTPEKKFRYYGKRYPQKTETQLVANSEPDQFLAGFNYYSNEGKKENSLREQINETRQALDFVPDFKFPVDYGPYKYVDRNAVYSKMQGEASGSVRKPTGQFGVGLKSSPTVAIKNGKTDANYIFGFDTKYTDEKGNLKPLDIPQWHFDRDAIKTHNAQRIDSIADTLASHANLEKKAEIYGKAEALKANQALKVDEISKRWEGRFNSTDALSKRSKANRIIAETTEKLPQILDSKVMKGLKTGGKAASVAGDVLHALNLGLTVGADYMDNGRLGKTSGEAAAGFIGDLGGSAAGAAIGATALGALVGFFSGGVLAAPAAAVGGYLGSVVGGFLGEKIAKNTYEGLYSLAK